jgi:hypothetical protein
MSVFDDQMEDWFDNDCQGSPSDYDGAGNIGEWSDLQGDTPAPVKVRTEAQGVTDEREKDSKRVSSVLAIKAELTLKSLIDCAVKFTLNLAKSTPTGKVESYSTGDSGHAVSTGDSGHAASTGYSGHAVSTGNSGHAASTGYSGHAVSSGDSGHAASTGYSGHASAMGKGSIAAAIGIEGMAKAAKGNWIVLAEYTEDRTIRWVKTEKIDGKTLKADTFYMLKKGKFVEVAQ